LDQPAEELVSYVEGLAGEPRGLPEAGDCRLDGDPVGQFVERGVRQGAAVGRL
jgi:hypothetical protein